MEPTTLVTGEPALSFTYDPKRSLFEQFSKAQGAVEGEGELETVVRIADEAMNASEGEDHKSSGGGSSSASEAGGASSSEVDDSDAGESMGGVRGMRMGKKMKSPNNALLSGPNSPFFSMFSIFEGSPTYKQRRKKIPKGGNNRRSPEGSVGGLFPGVRDSPEDFLNGGLYAVGGMGRNMMMMMQQQQQQQQQQHPNQPQHPHSNQPPHPLLPHPHHPHHHLQQAPEPQIDRYGRDTTRLSAAEMFVMGAQREFGPQTNPDMVASQKARQRMAMEAVAGGLRGPGVVGGGPSVFGTQSLQSQPLQSQQQRGMMGSPSPGPSHVQDVGMFIQQHQQQQQGQQGRPHVEQRHTFPMVGVSQHQHRTNTQPAVFDVGMGGVGSVGSVGGITGGIGGMVMGASVPVSVGWESGMVVGAEEGILMGADGMGVTGGMGGATSGMNAATGMNPGNPTVLTTKAFVCPLFSCGRMFKRMEHLRRHLRTHTMERPFQCSRCKKRFSRSDNLNQHWRTHLREGVRGSGGGGIVGMSMGLGGGGGSGMGGGLGMGGGQGDMMMMLEDEGGINGDVESEEIDELEGDLNEDDIHLNRRRHLSSSHSLLHPHHSHQHQHSSVVVSDEEDDVRFVGMGGNVGGFGEEDVKMYEVEIEGGVQEVQGDEEGLVVVSGGGVIGRPLAIPTSSSSSSRTSEDLVDESQSQIQGQGQAQELYFSADLNGPSGSVGPPPSHPPPPPTTTSSSSASSVVSDSGSYVNVSTSQVQAQASPAYSTSSMPSPRIPRMVSVAGGGAGSSTGYQQQHPHQPHPQHPSHPHSQQQQQQQHHEYISLSAPSHKMAFDHSSLYPLEMQNTLGLGLPGGLNASSVAQLSQGQGGGAGQGGAGPIRRHRSATPSMGRFGEGIRRPFSAAFSDHGSSSSTSAAASASAASNSSATSGSVGSSSGATGYHPYAQSVGGGRSVESSPMGFCVGLEGYEGGRGGGGGGGGGHFGSAGFYHQQQRSQQHSRSSSVASTTRRRGGGGGMMEGMDTGMDGTGVGSNVGSVVGTGNGNGNVEGYTHHGHEGGAGTFGQMYHPHPSHFGTPQQLPHPLQQQQQQPQQQQQQQQPRTESPMGMGGYGGMEGLGMSVGNVQGGFYGQHHQVAM